MKFIKYGLSLNELQKAMINNVYDDDRIDRVYVLSIQEVCRICGIYFKNGMYDIDKLKEVILKEADKTMSYDNDEDNSTVCTRIANKLLINTDKRTIEYTINKDLIEKIREEQ